MFEKYIQPKVLLEFNKRWKELEKETFYQYLELVEKDKDLNSWFTGIKDIKDSHETYIDGDLSRRVPKGLKYNTHSILMEVINEADKMITFI